MAKKYDPNFNSNALWSFSPQNSGRLGFQTLQRKHRQLSDTAPAGGFTTAQYQKLLDKGPEELYGVRGRPDEEGVALSRQGPQNFSEWAQAYDTAAAYSQMKEVQPLLTEEKALITGKIKKGGAPGWEASARELRTDVTKSYEHFAKVYDLAAQVYQDRPYGGFSELVQNVQKGVRAQQSVAGTFSGQAAAAQEAASETLLRAEAGAQLAPELAAAGEYRDYQSTVGPGSIAGKKFHQFGQVSGEGMGQPGAPTTEMWNKFRQDVKVSRESFNPYEYLQQNPQMWRILLGGQSPVQLQGMGRQGELAGQAAGSPFALESEYDRLSTGTHKGFYRANTESPGGVQWVAPGTKHTDEELVNLFFSRRQLEAQSAQQEVDINPDKFKPFDIEAAQTRQGITQTTQLGDVYQAPGAAVQAPTPTAVPPRRGQEDFFNRKLTGAR